MRMARSTHKPGVLELAKCYAIRDIESKQQSDHDKSVRLSLERRGRDVAALVSLEDLALLNDLEDRIDREAAREAVEEYGSVGKEVKKRFGL